MGVRVYTYAARIQDQERAHEVLYRANRFRNALVELKLDYQACMALTKLTDELDPAEVRQLYRKEQARARANSGLHCGTYNLIANSDARRAKKFRRFEGLGRVGAPINANSSCVKVADAFLPNSKVYLEATTVDDFEGKPQPRHIVHLGQGKGVEPIRAIIKLKRKLPPDGTIVNAWLQRRRIATHYKWELQLVVREEPTAPRRPVPGVYIGLDLGWRTREDTKRVAMLSDGTELLLDSHHFQCMDHIASLARIRDRAFNDAKPHHSMRSPERLAKRVHRGEFPSLEQWRAQDRHLADWHGFERKKTLGRRRQHYRALARQLCLKYDTIYIEAFDLRKPAMGHADRSGRQKTSPSEFRHELRLQAGNLGTRLVEVPAEFTTRICSQCHHVNLASTNLMVTCERCGDRRDQDLRAAENIRDLGHWLDAHPDRSQDKVQVCDILSPRA